MNFEWFDVSPNFALVMAVHYLLDAVDKEELVIPDDVPEERCHKLQNDLLFLGVELDRRVDCSLLDELKDATPEQWGGFAEMVADHHRWQERASGKTSTA